MSTQYPVLDNRPINKWKVTELREELKRRNLAIKGLKDDLVRRLDEALREEREAMEESKSSDSESEPVDAQVENQCDQVVDDARKDDGVNEVSEADDTVAKIETNDIPTNTENAKAIDEVPTGNSEHSTMVGVEKDSDAPLETITSVDVTKDPVEMVSSEMVLENKVEEDEVMKSSQNDVSIEGSSLLESSLDGVKEVVETKTVSIEEPNFMGEENGIKVLPDDGSGGTTAISKVEPENEGLEPLKMDVGPDLSHPSTQVREVIPNLGSQVKPDSIPSDSMPIYVTKELNDDLNADNFQLEQEIVRPEMVPPSANIDPSGVGIDHPTDDQMPSKSHGLVGGTDDDTSSDVKFSMKYENADQSFVDVSIIEHNMDNKATNNTELEVLSKDGNMNQAEFSCKEKESSVEEKLDIAASMEETKFQDGESKDTGFSKITDTDMVDGENLEKINLDQSSADDSMEEDIVEIKIVDSEQISSGVGEKTEEPHTKEPGLGLESSTNVSKSDIPSEAVEVSDGDKNKVLDASEKRKFQEAATPGSKEPAKRQRKWNYDSLKISEPKNSSISILTPKQISRPSLGGSDPTHDVDSPKERIVPESSRTPTNSLRIDNFVRPFTLKAVQELLGQTGKICDFWMDHIKTHCYVMVRTGPGMRTKDKYGSSNLEDQRLRLQLCIADLKFVHSVSCALWIKSLCIRQCTTHRMHKLLIRNAQSEFSTIDLQDWISQFSSIEEAIETRNAVYNLQWPTNGGRLLLADFVDPQEVKSRLEGPSKPTTPGASASPLSPAVPLVQTSSQPSPLARQAGPPEQVERPHPLSRQPPSADRPTMKERLARAASPVADKIEASILTLDDLFRKTRATPRIYYLPLTEEQVSKKLNEQRRNK